MSVQVHEKTRFTYDDYCRIPDDGKRHEIIHGEHCMSPAPSYSHQASSGSIFTQLYRQIDEAGTGLVFNAPFDVELGRYSIVQPDIVVVAESRSTVIVPSRIIGIPDLLIEILSPSNRRYDQESKRELYESAAVPEYWIVDNDSGTVERYTLRDGLYGEPSVETERIVYSRLEMSAEVDLMRVWKQAARI